VSTSVPDLSTIKQNQQKAWSAGDFSLVATPLVIVSETLCEAVDLRAGQRVLDIATGSGNTAIAAARRNTTVVGIDFVSALLDRARERAHAERLEITFQSGDAESLDFSDSAFDVVLSTFGVMFAPNHHRAAREMLRVTRPGGKIGLTCWTPEGRVGELFRLVSEFAPQPPGLQPPTLWGTEAHLRELLGVGVSDLRIERRHFVMRYRSPREWLGFFRTNFGPLHHAFGTLDTVGKQLLADKLTDWVTAANVSGDGTLIVPNEYLEIVATRRRD
jgi:SAM-dependent methyltransferase